MWIPTLQDCSHSDEVFFASKSVETLKFFYLFFGKIDIAFRGITTLELFQFARFQIVETLIQTIAQYDYFLLLF